MRPRSLFGALIVVALLKSGIQRSEAIPSYIEHTAKIDSFNAYFRTSPVLLLPGRVFGISSEAGWFIFHLLATAVFLCVVALSLRGKSLNHQRLLHISVLLGPAVAVLFTEVGRYDVFFLTGVLGVVSGSTIFGPLGAALMFLSNAEQGLAAAVCVAFIALVPELKMDRRRVFVALTIGAAVSISVMAWLQLNQDEYDSRWSAFQRNLEGSLLANFQSLPLLVFSMLGVMWLPFVVVLLGLQKKSSFLLLSTGCLFLPLALTLTTLDGTRVFVCVSFLPLLLLFVHWDFEPRLLESRFLTPALLATAVLLPALNVHLDGVVKAPFTEIYKFFRS